MSEAMAAGGGPRYVGAVARVDLLPKEIRTQAAVRATRRIVFLLVILAIVVVGAGYGAVQLLAANSAASLASANAQTQALLAKQGEYARVRDLESANDEADALDRVTTATQLDWDALLDEALAPLPGGTVVKGIQLDSQSPIDPLSQTTSPFGFSAVGSMSISLTSPNIDELTSWLATTRANPTFSFITALQTQNSSGWEMTATVYVSPSVTALPTPEPTETPAPGGEDGE